MTALADFLLARLAEDEFAADRLRGTEHRLVVVPVDTGGTETIYPGRLLSDVEAKRRIVEDYVTARTTNLTTEWGRSARFGLELAVTNLAQPYAGHPDFREEWRA